MEVEVWPSRAPVPNKPTVSVDVKQHLNNFLQSVTVTSLLFITNIWKSDHCLNMTLGADIKFTPSFLPAKSFCC